MKRILLLSLLLSYGTILSQDNIGMGIGTHIPHGSAILDINASNKGVLFPKVTLTSKTTHSLAAAPDNGLTVFNPVTNGVMKVGFYYWGLGADGVTNEWNQLVSSADIKNYITTIGSYTLTPIAAVTGQSGRQAVLKDGDGAIAGTFEESIVTMVRNGAAQANLSDISYSMENEKLDKTELTITTDVIESFQTIVNDQDVTNILNNFIGTKVKPATLTEFTTGENTDKVKLAYNFDNKVDPIKPIAESLTMINRVPDPNGGLTSPKISYSYQDETNDVKLKVITPGQDVIDDRDFIFNNTEVKNLITGIVTTEGSKASLESTPTPGGVQLNMTFKDGAGGADVKFEESLTVIKRDDTGNGTSEPKVSYSYTDEKGTPIAKAITPGQDIIDDREFIFNNEEIKNQITNIVNVNGAKAKLELAAAPNGVKLAMAFNNGLDGSADVLFEETLTSITKTAGTATEFTSYAFKDETELEAAKIEPSRDFINDVQLIFKDKTVIDQVTNLVTAGAKNPWNKVGTNDVATLNTEDMYAMGTVLIGSKTPLEIAAIPALQAKLHVKGNAIIEGSIYSKSSVYPDYVFEKYYSGKSDLNASYEFNDLNYVEEFIKAYNHLPGVTKIADLPMDEAGNYLIDFNRLSIEQLEKIEELYLYTIEQQSQIDGLKENLQSMEFRLQELEKLVFKK